MDSELNISTNLIENNINNEYTGLKCNIDDCKTISRQVDKNSYGLVKLDSIDKDANFYWKSNMIHNAIEIKEENIVIDSYMDNNEELILPRTKINKEDDINCDLNKYSTQNTKDERNIMETIRYLKKETEDNDNFELFSVSESMDIKAENLKVKLETDTFFEDQNSFVAHNHSGAIEFVEIQDAKAEEYYREEDIFNPSKLNEEIFTCNYCNVEFTTAENCKKHKNNCNKIITTPEKYSNNYRKKSNTTNELNIQYEHRLIPSNKKIMDNQLVIMATQKPNNRYECSQCNKILNSKRELGNHMNSHTKTISDIIKCVECNKSYLSEKITMQEEFKCNHCRNTCHLTCQLANHKLQTYIKYLYVCAKCNSTFPSSKELNKHNRTHTKLNYKCEKCTEKFKTKKELHMHLLIHNGIAIYTCAICNKMFEKQAGLNIHKNIHSKNYRLKCKHCGKSFKSRVLFKGHKNKHHDKRKSCSICNYKALTRRQMEIHMITHTGVNPYNCKHCIRTFASLSGLRAHIKIHIGKKTAKKT